MYAWVLCTICGKFYTEKGYPPHRAAHIRKMKFLRCLIANNRRLEN